MIGARLVLIALGRLGLSVVPFVAIAAVALSCVTTQVLAQSPNGTSPAEQPRLDEPAAGKICIVLSGGGARGFAHIGVLKVLEQLRVPIHCVVGTSMGAIVGGIYASGMTADQIEERFKAVSWQGIAVDRPERGNLTMRRKDEDYDYPLGLELGVRREGLFLPSGVVSGTEFDLLLERMTSSLPQDVSFDELPVQFRSVATDLETGKPVIFSRGPLAKAMRSSMSVPGLVAPIEVDGRLLADGGLVKNLPVDLAKALGADVVIAVNIATPLADRKSLRSLLDVSQQMITILTEQNVDQQKALLGPHDLLLSPQLTGVGFTEFGKIDEAIARGEEAARAAAPQLARLALPVEGYATYLATRPRPSVPAQVVDYVRFEPLQYVNPDVLAMRLSTKAGTALDKDRILADLATLQARGDFDQVGYRIETDSQGQTGVVFELKEKDAGRNVLRFGMNASIGTGGDSSLALSAGHVFSWINRWGGEWRNDISIGRADELRTEFYQPLGIGQRMFLSTNLQYDRRPRDFTDSTGQTLFRFDTITTRSAIELGQPIGRLGEWRLGVAHETLRLRGDIGQIVAVDPESQFVLDGLNVGFAETGLTSTVRVDTLDNAFLPRSGYRASVEGFYTSPGMLGADQYASRISAEGLAATSWGRHTLNFAMELGQQRFATQPIGFGYQLGGFQRLSGYQPYALWGSTLAFAKINYFNPISTVDMFGRSFVLGGTLEVGDVWTPPRPDRPYHRAGSVYAAVETPLGPAFFALGKAIAGPAAVYIFIGRP